MAKRKQTGKKVVDWAEEMKRQAQIAARMEANAGGGQFFGLQSGQLTWQGAPIENNQLICVVLDHILENTYYGGEAYDPDNPQPPTCFALGRDQDEMAPHDNVVRRGDHQNQSCEGCPMNEWGSADTGRGKACKNTRRLALVVAGRKRKDDDELIVDPEHYKQAEIGFLKLPVTSVNGWAGYVKQLAASLGRPPHGVATLIKVVPDPKTQFRVTFQLVDPLPSEVLGTIMERHEEVGQLIDFPYPDPTDEPSAALKRSKAKGKRARRY